MNFPIQLFGLIEPSVFRVSESSEAYKNAVQRRKNLDEKLNRDRNNNQTNIIQHLNEKII